MNHETHPLNSAGISIFFYQKSSMLALLRNKKTDFILIQLLNIIESLEIVLINMIAIFMMSAKLFTPGHLKIKS